MAVQTGVEVEDCACVHADSCTGRYTADARTAVVDDIVVAVCAHVLVEGTVVCDYLEPPAVANQAPPYQTHNQSACNL